MLQGFDWKRYQGSKWEWQHLETSSHLATVTRCKVKGINSGFGPGCVGSGVGLNHVRCCLVGGTFDVSVLEISGGVFEVKVCPSSDGVGWLWCERVGEVEFHGVRRLLMEMREWTLLRRSCIH